MPNIYYKVTMAVYDYAKDSRIHATVPNVDLRTAKQTLARWSVTYGVKGGFDVRKMVLGMNPAQRRKAFKNDRYDGFVTVTVMGVDNG